MISVKRTNGYLHPVNSEGSLHLSHSVVIGDGVELHPSFKSKIATIAMYALGLVTACISIYLFIVVGNIMDSIGVLLASASLSGLAMLNHNSSSLIEFRNEEETMYGLKKPIAYGEIDAVEVLSKIVGGKVKAEPFKSGELRIKTKSGVRHVLMYGADTEFMETTASCIAQDLGVCLHIDSGNLRTA